MSSVRLRLAPPGPSRTSQIANQIAAGFTADGIEIVKEERVRPVHRLSGHVREKTLSDKNQAWTRRHFFPVVGIIHA